jgi:hypothetical protein
MGNYRQAVGVGFIEGYHHADRLLTAMLPVDLVAVPAE